MTRRQSLWRRALLGVGLMTAAAIVIYAILYAFMGGDPFGRSGYYTYTLQAPAWRDGALSLGQDYPWLELAVYEGDWYVSFPPTPAVPVWLLTFAFGENVPENLLVRLYALGCMIAAFFALREAGWKWPGAAFMGLMTAFCGSVMALSTVGAVWYQAQMLALLLTLIAIWLAQRGKITPALLCYALSVGCRPFNVAFGPLIMLVWWRRNTDHTLAGAAKGLWKGVLLGLAVAAAYAAYNFARFGNPLEFGTSYLPEFMRSAHGEFSLRHVGGNIKSFVFGLPFEKTEAGWQLKKFGFSVFLANPLLLCLLIRFVWDAVRRRLTTEKALTVALFGAHLFLLLLHRTFGGFQFGARYAVDLVPYFIIYCCCDAHERPYPWEWLMGLAGTAFALYGVIQIHI